MLFDTAVTVKGFARIGSVVDVNACTSQSSNMSETSIGFSCTNIPKAGANFKYLEDYFPKLFMLLSVFVLIFFSVFFFRTSVLHLF